MSKFRVDHKKVVYVRWNGEPVQPPKGHYTAYYWVKGDIHKIRGETRDERWVKADVFGPDGQMFADGVLADTVDELKTLVPELIENFRDGFF
jgi:hypothetical protein